LNNFRKIFAVQQVVDDRSNMGAATYSPSPIRTVAVVTFHRIETDAVATILKEAKQEKGKEKRRKKQEEKRNKVREQ
jgi:hypothetical protein